MGRGGRKRKNDDDDDDEFEDFQAKQGKQAQTQKNVNNGRHNLRSDAKEPHLATNDASKSNDASQLATALSNAMLMSLEVTKMQKQLIDQCKPVTANDERYQSGPSSGPPVAASDVRYQPGTSSGPPVAASDVRYQPGTSSRPPVPGNHLRYKPGPNFTTYVTPLSAVKIERAAVNETSEANSRVVVKKEYQDSDEESLEDLLHDCKQAQEARDELAKLKIYYDNAKKSIKAYKSNNANIKVKLDDAQKENLNLKDLLQSKNQKIEQLESRIKNQSWNTRGRRGYNNKWGKNYYDNGYNGYGNY